MTGKRDFMALEERRLRGIALLAGGLSLSEVARQLGVTRQAVAAWEKRFATGGMGLLIHQEMGRARQLDSQQEQELGKALTAGALAAGYPTDQWTLQRIGKLIFDRFGVSYSTGHIWHVLDRMGLTHQRLEKGVLPRNEARKASKNLRAWSVPQNETGGQAAPLSASTAEPRSGRHPSPRFQPTFRNHISLGENHE